MADRIKRVLAVLAILCAAAAALCFFAFMILAMTAIAFSGTTGSAWQAFLPKLLPLARFSAGAFLAGGAAALINAVAAARGWAGKTVLAAALLGGLAATLVLPLGTAVVSVAAAAFQLFGKLHAASR